MKIGFIGQGEKRTLGASQDLEQLLRKVYSSGTEGLAILKFQI